MTGPPPLGDAWPRQRRWSGQAATDSRAEPWPTPAADRTPRQRARASYYHRYGKRALDIVLGTLLFVGLLPMMAAVAVAVLVTSGWPILYRAERLGRHGRPMRMLKFRTMIRDADEALADLLSSDAALAAEYRKNLKLREDPRKTKLGAILRKLSIDELPQFWHVITGEMSLVGPRPYAAMERELVSPHPEIFECSPGITGPWQVRGRNRLPPQVRVALDLEYVAHVGLTQDLWHVLATMKCLIRPDGR
jgi:lipopolysaccharide/colanic/teichoic acid biosynthesis glycosyltransferase